MTIAVVKGICNVTANPANRGASVEERWLGVTLAVLNGIGSREEANEAYERIPTDARCRMKLRQAESSSLAEQNLFDIEWPVVSCSVAHPIQLRPPIQPEELQWSQGDVSA